MAFLQKTFTKHRLATLLCLATLLALFGNLQAQTVLYSESFETDGEGTRYTSNSYSDCGANNPDFFLRTNTNPALPAGCVNNGHGTALTLSPLQGTYYWAGEDIRSNGIIGVCTVLPCKPPGEITTQSINISGYTALQVSLMLATANNNGTRWEWSDSINIQASINGGAYSTVGRFIGNAQFGGDLVVDDNLNGIIDVTETTVASTATFTKYTFSIPGSGSSLNVRLVYHQLGGSEETGMDLIEVTGTFTCAPPTIAADPTDAACCNYTSASFTVTGNNATGYQWQVSTNGGGSFTNIANGGYYSNVTTQALTVTNPAVSMNGYKYRCVVTGGCNPAATSNYANLTVTQGPQFTQHPQNASICDGGNTSFSVAISASGFPSYTWYHSYDGGNTYVPVPNTGNYSGTNTNTLTITGATAGMNGFLYRVKLGNSACANASPPSNSATLTVGYNINYYQDSDGDTYGNPLVSVSTCTGQPVGYVTNNTDCNDANPAIHPGGTEICGNSIDEDCNTTDLACGGPNTWLGHTTQWGLGSNWSSGSAPTAVTDALIPAAPVGGFFPQAAVPANVHDLEMQNGATASFNSHINVYGNFTGGSSSNCVVQGNGGVVNFCGTQDQTISGYCRFKKVVANTTSPQGVSITGHVQIIDALVMQRGDVVNSGSLTLVSDANGTAYVDFFTYPVGGILHGNVTVQRYIDNASTGYRDISIPVSTTVADLADDFTVTGADGVNCWYAYSPYPTLQEYREDANADTDNYYGGFWSVTSPSRYLEAGRGYAARIYNAPLTLDVTGTVNYGLQFVPLTNTPSGNAAADGWNLIGNPFAAPLKWSLLKAGNPGATDGSCYRFTTTGEYAGTWSTHNGVTGVPLGTPDEIATFQGFFVLAPASTYLFVDNTHCTDGTAVPFFKTGELTNEIRLQLTNGTHADEAVTYTDAGATTGYDAGHDGVKMPAGGAVNISFAYPGKQYAINVLDDITAQTELPLGIQVAEDGAYTLNPLALNLTGLTAYLKDAQTNTLTDLATAPVLNLLATGNYTGRYSVVFQPAIVAGIEEANKTNVRVYADNGTLTVSRSSSSTQAQISVVNMLGQQLAQVATGLQKTEVQLPLAASGYVFVKVQEGSKVSVVKVLINNN